MRTRRSQPHTTMQTHPPHHRAAAARMLAVACLLAGLGACSTLDVPRADNYPASSQKKVRAVHHWDVLADDVATRVATRLAAAGRVNAAVQVVPVHADDSAFKQGFRELLMTRLLERGVAVATGSGALRLEVGTQVVRHGAFTPANNPAPWTTLAGSVAVVRDMSMYHHSTFSGIFAGLGVGAALDAASYARRGPAAGGPTGTEVLVSTALHDGQLYLARTADIYYIEGADTVLFEPPPRPPAPVPTPTRTWKVVAQ